MNHASFPELAHQVAIVTGGAKGIGAATVELLKSEGAQVAIFDIDETAAADLANSLGRDVIAITVDVSKSAAVEDAFQAVNEHWGPCSLLVNNAGIQHYGTVTTTTEEDWDRVLNTNLKSAFLCAKQGIGQMQQRGGGVIVNVASVQSFLSQSQVAPYTTSKTALLGLTRSIAVDYAPTIRCVAVCPGTVDTPMLAAAVQASPDPQAVLRECHEMHPLGRIASASEVADLIVYLLSDRAGFMSGHYYRIDGGLGLAIGGSKRDA